MAVISFEQRTPWSRPQADHLRTPLPRPLCGGCLQYPLYRRAFQVRHAAYELSLDVNGGLQRQEDPI